MDKIYDVIILGAGPAGLAAGLYAGRYRLSTLVIEKAKDGGQIAITDEIENYPGQMVEGESGPSLIARMTQQVEKFGAERANDTINKVELEGPVKKLYGTKDTYQCKTLIIATGAFPRPIGCKREGEFMGKGVSFCATCDANFFEDMEVYVVGGGDSAVEEAMYLTKKGDHYPQKKRASCRQVHPGEGVQESEASLYVGHRCRRASRRRYFERHDRPQYKDRRAD